MRQMYMFYYYNANVFLEQDVQTNKKLQFRQLF
mgnify:CR=1 FL=1